MERYLCIHGHFYQPPRENPWLEEVEQQDSAAPFHDWNQRISAECYAPNSASRILDQHDRIINIVSNYSQISFNFGPTLLSWLERHEPDTYEKILAADQESQKRFSGHGSALAQAYNHIIMPLANERDKRTQIIWGLADFRARFGRQAEGMWLPETAVDTESLELLAEYDVRFTILAPHQAKRIRPVGEADWHDCNGHVDTRRPYICPLPSGRKIAIFFYDGPASQEVAFSELLRSGEKFGSRLLHGFSSSSEPQLVHIATDGETYGHHHRFGDMALAYCLSHIQEENLAKITIYGEFLESFPPQWEVEIVENSSWSCAHGVERWRSDCGCRIGGNSMRQHWRAPLRETLDWLRDQLADFFEQRMSPFHKAPWGLRDRYVQIILDRSQETLEDFLTSQVNPGLTAKEKTRCLSLLEMQRQALLMFTSCGWFFDEVSGIETAQILCYAARAVQLATKLGAKGLNDEFQERLAKIPSNLAQWGDARKLFQVQIAPLLLDLNRVAAHSVIAAQFRDDCDQVPGLKQKVYCYRAQGVECEKSNAGRLQLSVGLVRIESSITLEQDVFSFAVLYLGGHHLSAGVCKHNGPETYQKMRQDILGAFQKSDVPEVVRQMDHHFGDYIHNLWHLFRDEQRQILNQVMEQTLEDIEGSYEKIYNDHFALMQFLRSIKMPVPKILAAPVEMVLATRFRQLLERDNPQPGQIKKLADEVEQLGWPLNDPSLALAAEKRLYGLLTKFSKLPCNLALLMTINETMEVLGELPLSLDLWESQNIFWSVYQDLEPELFTNKEDSATQEWAEQFRRLSDFLKIGIFPSIS